jgi:hypothetical protein
MYKNCVGNVIKIKFDNSVTIYLNKDEKALEKFSRRRILSVAKYDLRVTVAGDKYMWISIPFIINEQCIYERRNPPSNSSSVKALI